MVSSRSCFIDLHYSVIGSLSSNRTVSALVMKFGLFSDKAPTSQRYDSPLLPPTLLQYHLARRLAGNQLSKRHDRRPTAVIVAYYLHSIKPRSFREAVLLLRMSWNLQNLCMNHVHGKQRVTSFDNEGDVDLACSLADEVNVDFCPSER